MEVYFTRHARNRMRFHDVAEESVRAMAANPDWVSTGAFGTEHAWKQIGEGRWLRVTFRDEGERRS